MPSTLAPTTITTSVVVIDEEPSRLADTLQSLVHYRSSDEPVPAELLNSIRAYRFRSLAEAIERYNDRVARTPVVAPA